MLFLLSSHFYKKTASSVSSSILLLSAALLLSACATPPEPRVGSAQMRIHLESLLSEHLYLMMVTDRCSSLGGATKDAMNTARNNWLTNYGLLMRNANDYYVDLLGDELITFDDQDISLKTIYWIYKELDNIEDDLSFMRYSNANRALRCQRLIDDFGSNAELPSFALSQPQAYLQIMEYSQNRKTDQPELTAFPLPFGQFELNPEKGRSAFHIEKLLEEVNCPSKEVITLINDWPEEAYIGYCKDGTERVVTCKWGTCTIQR